MPPELLQKMRDIHYPGDPSWFPPAPGWWLVAALLIAALIWLYRRFYRYRRDRAPYQWRSTCWIARAQSLITANSTPAPI